MAGSHSRVSADAHRTGRDLSLKRLSWSNHNPKRQLMPGKSKTARQRKRSNRRCHMVWIWDFFFSSAAFFPPLFSFLSSSWETLRDPRVHIPDSPCSLYRVYGRGGNFHGRPRWRPAHFLPHSLLGHAAEGQLRIVICPKTLSTWEECSFLKLKPKCTYRPNPNMFIATLAKTRFNIRKCKLDFAFL